MTKTIGVLGLGSIGMRHAKNLLAMGHKVYGLDQDISKEKEAIDLGCSEMPIPFEIVHECEAMVVATPTPDHHISVRRCALYGPHLLIEKPISDSLWEGDLERYLEMAREKKRVVMVGNNLRFHACVKQAKEWMSLIGAPIWASFTISQKNERYTDPCILNWGAHEVDLALYLLGPARVTGAAGDDDWADVLCIHTDQGVPSTIHCDYLTPVERRGFCILGTKGNISCDLVLRTIKFTPAQKGEMVQFNVMKDTFDENYKDEMQAFIDLIDGKPRPEAATGEDGLAALEIILEAQRIASIQ